MSSLHLASRVMGVCAMLVIGTASANASTVQYFSQSTWSANTTGVTNIDFEGTGANSSSTANYSNSTGYMASGVDFIGRLNAFTYALSVVDPGYLGGLYNFGSGAILRGPWYSGSFSPYIHVVLPANTTAIATNLASISPLGVPFQITLSDGSQYTASTPSDQTLGFFGVTSDAPIAYADFAVVGLQGNTNYPIMDNFQFGTAAAPPADTPEAASMLLIGSGLVALTALRKRQTRGREQSLPRSAPGLWSFMRP